MSDPGPMERARENVTGIVSMLVTGIWLTAMISGFEHWLALMLFGYVVVIPIVAILFGEEDDQAEWWNDDAVGSEERTTEETADESADEALETLRRRYASGEITEEQFERKVERLLETETLEDVEDRYRGRSGDADAPDSSASDDDRARDAERTRSTDEASDDDRARETE